ncbi:endo-1,4-beta-xylanase A precursor [Stereum hirsutum FP-91666 SS1]|uniref:endo-1,4-beta-xylanase A precursor n=1 Tax=Stereum hirsutum (strain FP-91666) TaxID=721885 RepID=UPI000440DBE4|nr:endo-1,4-beta-xylanase A precursor [Stereum hirsutum FP-91666 SS1]EIM91462.1 endo-1,4-beta-xylanase A precursor [Stereum hirsutum FP-91666 SS1]
MLRLSKTFAALVIAAPFVAAQSAVWGQCGGTGWTGPTTCAAGSTCAYSNDYYSRELCIVPCLRAHILTTSTWRKLRMHPRIATSTSTGSASLPSGTSTAKLNTLATGNGKVYFGSATDNPELTDTAYVAILSDNTMFGQITPGNSWKWDATEPTQGTFTFTAGDAILDLAQANGQLLRGHNCVWYNQLPSWVSSGTLSASELESAMVNHCTTLLTHYKGGTYSFDIVNEPFNDDGTWRTDVFYNELNTTYVPTVLTAARAADPSTKLYINEYNLEYASGKSASMLSLVKSLLADDVPLDGIGFQGHLIVGQVPTSIQSQMEAFTALGVEVAITELDIRMTLPATEALYEQQKTDYQNVIAACQAVDGCVGVTIWDYTDKYSWVPSTFSGQGAACPWDSNLVIKPAFDGIVAGMSA